MIRDIFEVDPKHKERIKKFIDKVGLEWTPECEEADFLVMDNEGAWAAVVGVARIHEYAVLRTLVLDPKQCDGEDLMRLLAAAITKAERQGAEALYFLTVAAPDIFEPLGFTEVAIDDIPMNLQEDPLFNKEESQSVRVMTYSFHQ